MVEAELLDTASRGDNVPRPSEKELEPTSSVEADHGIDHGGPPEGHQFLIVIAPNLSLIAVRGGNPVSPSCGPR